VWLFDVFRLAKRLAVIEERFAAVEKAFTALDNEFTDQLDRYRRLHSRIAKRAALIEQHEPEETTEGEPLADVPAPGPAGMRLSPAAARLNQQILARRRRILGGDT